MRSLMASRICAIALFFAIFLCPSVTSRKVLKSKIRARGKEYKIDKSSDLEMCKAVVWEMHGEIHKHQLTANGEESIFDTSELAVCLGVVQNYTFTPSGAAWRLIKKERSADETEDDEWAALAENPALMDGVLLTKQACTDFCEEVQMEISETMYARTLGESAHEIAESFCPELLRPKKSESKGKKTPYVPAEKATWENPEEKMMEFLRERDTSGAINDLLQMEAEHPEKMLDEHLQREIRRGRDDLVCEVCAVAVKVAANRASDLRSTPQYKDRWQREALVSEIVTRVCHGKDYKKIAEGYYPSVPGNPPEWADSWEVSKGEDGRWQLKRNKAKKQGEEDASTHDERAHEHGVMRRAMISQACKAAIDNRLSEDDGDLAELLVDHGETKKGKQLAQEYCQPLCSQRKSEL